MSLNHPQTTTLPSSCKNCLPRNWSLVPKKLRTTPIEYYNIKFPKVYFFSFPLLFKNLHYFHHH